MTCITCHKLLDIVNFKGFEKKLEKNISESDNVAKICGGHVEKQKIQPCSGFFCWASQFDDKLEWVQCDQCEDWFHMMCEGIPGCEYPRVELMACHICSKCRELALNIGRFYLQTRQSEKVKSLEIAINKLTVNYDKLRHDFQTENSMWDLECCLLRILDDIGVKRQAFHENVFVGNHCKVNLAKDRNGVFNFCKLCSVLPDESLRKIFFDLFDLFGVAGNLMACTGYLNSELN